MTQTKMIKEALDNALLNNDTVFIVPHNIPDPDYDALGAALGIALICKKNKKKCYIIVDIEHDKLKEEERKIVEYLAENFNVINSKQASDLITDNSLMVAVDVSRNSLLSEDAKKNLSKFNDIFALDHHRPDIHTFETQYLFVDDKLSSTCEEIARLLCLYHIKVSPQVATYLFAGIALDTNKLTKNVSNEAFDVANRLKSKGADMTYVYNNMLSSDYEDDRKMLRIINNVIFPSHLYAVAYDKDVCKTYEPIHIARAADYLLNYKINASFAIGYIDNDTISISARSKGGFDVSNVCKMFGGGGNEFSAAARVHGETISSVITKLNFILCSMCEYDVNLDNNETDCMKLKLCK